RQRGQEFGATTGRPRRTGWFDAAALKRSIQLNGVSGLCITKLDVLDGVEAVKICVGYELEGAFSEILPVGAEELERCHPVYEELPGWMESTVGVRAYEELPRAARAYLERIGALAGVALELTRHVLIELEGGEALRAALLRFARAYRGRALGAQGIATFRTVVPEIPRFRALARTMYAAGAGEMARQLADYLGRAMRAG